MALRPTRKVSAGLLAGLVWALAVAIAHRVGLDDLGEVEATGGALVSFIAAWWTTEGP